MNTAFRIWLLTGLFGYALAVRFLFTIDERALWLLLVPCLPLLDTLIHAAMRADGPSLSMRWMYKLFFVFRFVLRKYFRIQLASRHRGPRPAGFCPYCSYPVDPGRCPECGVRVTPENIARQPKPSQAGAIRLAVILVLVVGAGWGGYYYYRQSAWVEHASVSTLLRLSDMGEPRATAELVRRVNSGKLKTSEEQEICRRSLKINIVPRGPYTRDGLIGVGLVAETRLPALYSSMWIYLRDVEVFVDGKKQEKRVDNVVLAVGSDDVKVTNDKLGAGSHVIRVCGQRSVARAMIFGDPGAAALVSGPFDVSATIEVEDRDSAAVFEAVVGEAIETDIRDNITVKYVKAQRRNSDGKIVSIPTLVINNGSARGLPIAGRVMVRRANKGEFQEAAKLICNAGETDSVLLSGLEDIDKARLIDVRIDPDPCLMPCFRREGEMKYIGEVIERKKLRRESGFFGF